MERGFNISPDEFYHVYSRGVDRRVTFSDNRDYEHFLKLLYLCNSTERIEIRNLPKFMSVYYKKRPGTLVDIGAYCLMPNHFHLLLYEKEDGGITKFMAKLLTAYVKYFNKKEKRIGALFDGRFRARYVDDDSYMHYLYAYIHLNPLKIIQKDWKEKGIKDIGVAENFLREYTPSSFQDYIGEGRMEAVILNREPFPEYFTEKGDFPNFIKEWIEYKDDF